MIRKLNIKIIIGLLLIPLLIILFNLVDGYRFTPIQAIKSSSFIKGDIKIFGEIDRDWVKVYLLETQDGLKTAVAEKRGLMWSCPSVTYFFDDIIKDDKVKTVGWVSIDNKKNKQITVFAVQTNDPNIKFIEAGLDSERQRKNISLNETVIFTWDKVINSNINAIAFDKDNHQVYKYGYNPEHLNFIDLKELRWYLLDNR
ncbi:MAG: hypothetical protein ABRQ25_19340 [Clostridiaceae bacterium]